MTDFIFEPFKVICLRCSALVLVSIEALNDNEEVFCSKCHFVFTPNINITKLLKLISLVESNKHELKNTALQHSESHFYKNSSLFGYENHLAKQDRLNYYSCAFDFLSFLLISSPYKHLRQTNLVCKVKSIFIHK